MHDHKQYRVGTSKEKLIYGAHVLLAVVAMFLTVGGTYGTIVSIIDAGTLSGVFSCADNSNTVGV